MSPNHAAIASAALLNTAVHSANAAAAHSGTAPSLKNVCWSYLQYELGGLALDPLAILLLNTCVATSGGLDNVVVRIYIEHYSYPPCSSLYTYYIYYYPHKFQQVLLRYNYNMLETRDYVVRALVIIMLVLFMACVIAGPVK